MYADSYVVHSQQCTTRPSSSSSLPNRIMPTSRLARTTYTSHYAHHNPNPLAYLTPLDQRALDALRLHMSVGREERGARARARCVRLS